MKIPRHPQVTVESLKALFMGYSGAHIHIMNWLNVKIFSP
jgi:hypothetical protein